MGWNADDADNVVCAAAALADATGVTESGHEAAIIMTSTALITVRFLRTKNTPHSIYAVSKRTSRMDIPDHLITIAAKTPDAHVAEAKLGNLRNPGNDRL